MKKDAAHSSVLRLGLAIQGELVDVLPGAPMRRLSGALERSIFFTKRLLARLGLSLLLAAIPTLQGAIHSTEAERIDGASPMAMALSHNREEYELSPSRELPELEIHIKGQLGHNLATRDYLNGLVAESAAEADQQVSNIAFVKTHKTASTTFAYVLYRYARRHGSKLALFDDHRSAIPLDEAVEQTEGRKGKPGKGKCDIMHYHISMFGPLKCTWKVAEQAYRRILRNAEVNFVTVIREPRSHLLSYYYYFMQPNTGVSITDFLTKTTTPYDPEHQRLFNPLSAEFGVKNQEGLQYILNTALPNMKLVLLTEEIDEGLMVLRRLLKWEMIDMTYSYMYKSKTGGVRYDGKRLVEAPPFEALPVQVQKLIDEKTKLDRRLYNAAVKEYKKRKDQIPHDILEADLAEFAKLQREVKTYMEQNKTSKAKIMYHSANIYANENESPLYEF